MASDRPAYLLARDIEELRSCGISDEVIARRLHINRDRLYHLVRELVRPASRQELVAAAKAGGSRPWSAKGD